MGKVVELHPKKRTYNDAVKARRKGDGVQDIVNLAEVINRGMLDIIEEHDTQGVKGLMVIMADLLAKLCLVGEESGTELDYNFCEKLLEDRYIKRALEAHE